MKHQAFAFGNLHLLYDVCALPDSRCSNVSKDFDDSTNLFLYIRIYFYWELFRGFIHLVISPLSLQQMYCIGLDVL